MECITNQGRSDIPLYDLDVWFVSRRGTVRRYDTRLPLEMIELHRHSWRDTLTLQALPNDLKLVGLFLVGAYSIVLFGVGEVTQIAVVAVLLCFLPGYVTVAALFPWRDHETSPRRPEAGVRISVRERMGVSFGLSIALLPILGLALEAASMGFSTYTVLNTVGGYILVVGVVAIVRRRQLPESDRFELPIGSWFDELEQALTGGSIVDRTLTVVLFCSILLAGMVFIFAVGSPVDGQTYTDFHLLTAEDGEYVSGGYPDELVVGEGAELAWGIHNSEGVDAEYTVIVTQERVTESEGELVRLETVELDRQQLTVEDGERAVYDHEIFPTLTGENLRISYYLYRGDAPDSPSADDSYRSLHVWVDVEPSA